MSSRYRSCSPRSLIKYFYNSDLDISLAAINASASLGNEAAIRHLLTDWELESESLPGFLLLAPIRGY